VALLRRSRHFALRSLQTVMPACLRSRVNRGTTLRRDRGVTGQTLRPHRRGTRFAPNVSTVRFFGGADMPIPVATQTRLAVLSQRQDEASTQRPTADVRLKPVAANEASQAKQVLLDSLGADPTLQWCFLKSESKFINRLRAYIDVGHRWHCAQGHPVHGAYEGAYLVGVAYLALPEPLVPVEFEPFETDLLRFCGADALERFGHYNRAVAAASPSGHLFSLAMLGVRRSHQGRGIGTRLIQWASASCDADPRAAGLITDSGDERVARLFSGLGYREIAQVAVNAELRQSVLFRPRGSRLA
jgi:ribosomal protein S18 acetylase RimI-like enzyme